MKFLWKHGWMQACAWLCLITLPAGSLVAQPAAPPESLTIVAVEGDGGINNIHRHSTAVATVRVVDAAKHPVPGAVVVFSLPTDGASGAFSKGAKTIAVTTDEQGQASARWKPNSVAGQVPVHINASYRGRTARATVTQFNMEVPSAKAKSGSGKLIVILAVAGAAAAGGAYAGLHKGGTTSSVPATPPSITIIPGTGSVGPPAR